MRTLTLITALGGIALVHPANAQPATTPVYWRIVEWQTPQCHPSVDAHTDVTIKGLQIAGDPERVRDWLNWPADEPTTIDFTFVAPHGTPGLLAGTFETPDGEVTV